MFTNEDRHTLHLIKRMLLVALKVEVSNMKELDDLAAEVAANTTVVGSVLALIDNLSQHSADPAQLAALVTQLKANDQAIADKVALNTPAATGPTGPAESGPAPV